MDELLQTETIIVELLLIAAIVAMVVRRIRLPYTVALVIVGLTLTAFAPLQLELTQELILLLFLPPLLFEAAFHVDFQLLRRYLTPILVLAIPGVLLSAFIVGGIVALGAGLSLPVALVFGALIVATDPVAVIAVFRSVGAPKALATVVEGESLFNDGTAVVLFNIVLGVALTGEFSLIEGLWEFVWVSAGGLGIGLGLGWLTVQLISRIDDYLIETTLTTVLAYGAFLLAESIHVSGVLAVVAAGILNGNIGPKGMSASTKIVLFNFWEYLAFLVNSLIFLLIGLEVEWRVMLSHIGPIGVALVAVTLARVIAVYGLSRLANYLPGDSDLPLTWQHVLNWGGLRGAVSLALALGLPPALADRSLLLSMTFGVVLVTLLLQATTIERLLRWLGLIGRLPLRVAYEEKRGQLLTLRAARRELDQMHNRGQLSPRAWEVLEPEVAEAEAHAAADLRELVTNNPKLEEVEIGHARRHLLLTRRAALYNLQHDDLIDGQVFEELAAKLDEALDEIDEAHS